MSLFYTTIANRIKYLFNEIKILNSFGINKALVLHFKISEFHSIQGNSLQNKSNQIIIVQDATGIFTLRMNMYLEKNIDSIENH